MTPQPQGDAGARRRRLATWRRYGAFLRRPPLLSLEWSDDRTPARAWLVINSLRGGAAGGGTRMRSGLIRREVVYLAKTMELKFVFSGPAIGGAKAGIDFDPADPRRPEVLRRWFRLIAPQLRSYYGTGGDLNVDEVLDVVPCCQEIGLAHPQEGVVRGHVDPGPGGMRETLRALDDGVAAPVRGELGVAGCEPQVADLITGYGLARSIVHLFARQGRELRGARVAIEGFGSVGGPCALYLARAGARLVALADHEKVLVNQEGLGPDAIEGLIRRRTGKSLPAHHAGITHRRGAFHSVAASVFVSAAISGTVDLPRLERLRQQGVDTIACGANHTFREAQLGSTRVQRTADESFTIIPDVIANCGMARAFSALIEDPTRTDPEQIFQAVDQTIASSVHHVLDVVGGGGRGLLASTLKVALDPIESH
jgi:glutamate dehydrogenase/leucine dehydrogenase